MSEQTFPQVIARAAPADEPAAGPGVRRSLTATLRGQQWVAISDGAGTPAEVLPGFASFGDGNALLTASILCGLEGAYAAVDLGQNVPADSRALVTGAALYAGTPDAGAALVSAAVLAETDGLEVDPGIAVQAAAFRYAFDGQAWRALRAASGETLGAHLSAGAQLIAPPGQWSMTDAADENTLAFVTRDAPEGEARLVCTAISARVVDPSGLQTGVRRVTLSDDFGELWSGFLLLKADGADETGQPSDRLELSGLNIVAGPASALYLEFDDAAGAGTFESVSMAGYTAGALEAPVLTGSLTIEVGESTLQPGELAGYSDHPLDTFGVLIASDLGDYTAFQFLGALPALGDQSLQLTLEGSSGPPPENLQAAVTVYDELNNPILGPLLLSSADSTGTDGNRRDWTWFNVGSYFLDGLVGEDVFVEFTAP